MAKDSNRSAQIYARVKPDLYDEFSEWADRLGVSLSQFANLCIQAGMRQIVRSIYPEKAMTTDQWAEVFTHMAEKGDLDSEELLKAIQE